jgi:tetratricopeptide (TPR) repeat protein
MRQVPADKYNIAWFKLAEFVARGEKERALGIYRLLVHSFNDRAFSIQLEGDLLAAFNDEQAIDKYVTAAQLYQKEGRVEETIGLYELLVTMRPQHEQFVHHLFQLYESTGNRQRLFVCAELLCDLFLNRADFINAWQLINRCQSSQTHVDCLPLYQKYLLALIAHEADAAEIQKIIAIIAAAAQEDIGGTGLQKFLQTVEAVSKNHYQLMLEALKR